MKIDSSEYRFLRKFMILTGLMWLGFGVASTSSGYSFGPYQLGASLLTLVLFLLQPHMSHAVIAHTVILANFILIAFNALVTGGSSSPSIWMYTLGPHYGSFTQGRKGAIGYFGVSLVFVWLILWTDRYHPLQQSYAPNDIRRAAMQTFLLVLVYYLAWSQRSALEEQIDLLRGHEGELRKARDIAEQASSARSRFLATMSHEIRTPLNGIVGLPDLLRQADTAKAREELIDLLQSSGTHLLGIVNDILDFSKLESATPTIRMQSFDLEELVESVLQSSSFLPGASSLELVACFESEGPYTILGDSRRLEQILRNLVSNAIKFTRQGQVMVRCSLDDPKASIVVKDTGIGISEQDRQRVFEPFEQVNDDLQREFGGTGLGLAISSKIAKTMGGSLSLESTPGVGSVFTLKFPAPRMFPKPKETEANPPLPKDAPAERSLWALDFPHDSLERLRLLAAQSGWSISTSQGTRRCHYGPCQNKVESLRLPVTRSNFSRWLGETEPVAAVADAAGLGNGHRVLVVDDNQINRMVTKNLLQNFGCEVEVATNGEESLQVLAEGGPFSLILMDVHMPVMDGIRATQEIRARGSTVPIIALTADVFPEARASVMAAGANGLQHKPIRAADLSDLLKAYPAS